MCSSVFLQDKAAAAAAATPAKSKTKQETSKSSPSEPKISPGNKRPSAGGNSKGDSGGKRAKKTGVKEEESVKGPGGQRPKNSKRRSVASKVSYKEESNSDVEQLSEEEFEAMSEEEDSTDSESEAKSTKQKMGKARGKQNVKKRRSSGDRKPAQDEDQKTEEDDDFEEERGPTRGNKAKQRSSKKREGPGVDEWLEVYLEKTSSWVCVDVEHGVALPHLCSRNATAPMTYVVSVDGDGFVKDLGRKYDPTWMTSSRKRRVDEEWWEETLEPFLGPEDERDRKEDKEVRQHSTVCLFVCFSSSVVFSLP